jgi:hypothetical protein
VEGVMRRREFIGGLIGVGASLGFALPSLWTAPLHRVTLSYAQFMFEQRKRERAIRASGLPLEEIDDNFWNYREYLRSLDSSVLSNFSHAGLSAVDAAGYRHCSVYLKDGGEIERLLPWTLKAHQQENRNWRSIALPCDDCGALPRNEHHWECKHSTSLAYHLAGKWDDYKTI